MIDNSHFKDPQKKEILLRTLKKRNYDLSLAEKAEKLIVERNDLIQKTENLQNEKNLASRKIGEVMKEKGANSPEIKEAKDHVSRIGENIKEYKEKLADLEKDFEELSLAFPNILDEEVPEGKDDADNKVLRVEGSIPGFPALPHFESAEKHQLIDFERGVKISGSRFYVYNEQIARLERHLVNFMLDIHTSHGYKERTVPLLVKNEAMKGTGQFPKFQEEYYHLEKDELNLIPTAEVPLTNLYYDEIIPAEALPILLTAQTPCFRREAGSAGKDTRGLVRVHQFTKVELVKFTRPEESAREHEKLLADAESILKRLHLTYRVVLLSSGDTSFSSAKTYDLEIYMPGLKRWMEISSVSNFRDFQSRRAKIRYKNPDTGKNELVHTLNGSGVAAGRLLAALMEYYQTPDGNVDFPRIYSLLG